MSASGDPKTDGKLDLSVVFDSLNQAAQVANALNPKDPPQEVAWLRDQLWASIDLIREYVFGPHDSSYPIPQGLLDATLCPGCLGTGKMHDDLPCDECGGHPPVEWKDCPACGLKVTESINPETPT